MYFTILFTLKNKQPGVETQGSHHNFFFIAKEIYLLYNIFKIMIFILAYRKVQK